MALVQRALIRITRGNHTTGRTAALPVQITVDRVRQAGQCHRIRRLGRIRHPDGVHHRTPRLLQLLRAHVLRHHNAGRLRIRHNRHREAVALRQRGIRIRRHSRRHRDRIHHRVTIHAADRLGIAAAVGRTRRQRASGGTVTHAIKAAAHPVIIQRRQGQVRVTRVHHPDAIGHVAAGLGDLARRTGFFNSDGGQQRLGEYSHQSVVRVHGSGPFVVYCLRCQGIGEGITRNPRVRDQELALVLPTRGDSTTDFAGRPGQCCHISISGVTQRGDGDRIRGI